MAKKKKIPEPPYNYDLGHAVYGYKQRRYVDTRKPVGEFSRPCVKCGHRRTVKGHDPCIANLPGVIGACCGHGVEQGYVTFQNGIVIRGQFEFDSVREGFMSETLEWWDIVRHLRGF